MRHREREGPELDGGWTLDFVIVVVGDFIGI